MEILSPTVELDVEKDAGQLAGRLGDLENRRIVAIWNGRRPGPGREFLTSVLQHLDDRHHLASWEVVQKPYLGNPAPADLVDEVLASGADAVLTGLGD